MPDEARQVTTDAVAPSRDGLANTIRILSSITATATKLDRRRPLTDYEIGLLEAAKQYIDLALKNDRYWKEGNVA